MYRQYCAALEQMCIAELAPTAHAATAAGVLAPDTAAMFADVAVSASAALEATNGGMSQRSTMSTADTVASLYRRSTDSLRQTTSSIATVRAARTLASTFARAAKAITLVSSQPPHHVCVTPSHFAQVQPWPPRCACALHGL
jgi:hypothetical protein